MSLFKIQGVLFVEEVSLRAAERKVGEAFLTSAANPRYDQEIDLPHLHPKTRVTGGKVIFQECCGAESPYHEPDCPKVHKPE